MVVDAAFKRLFGYSWGTTFDLTTTTTTTTTNNSNVSVSALSSVERQMIQIFGPTRTARILNLPWDVVAPVSAGSNTAYMDDYYNPAAMLTTKIVSTDAAISIPFVSLSSLSAAAALQSDSSTRRSKKMRLEEKDYKNIALPNHMVSSNSSLPSTTANTSQAAAVTTAAASGTSTSNLDSVLSQIAGKKQINTVEKSSNDWEGFKESDKTLQDELERNAQSKNAYLVKQDFLNRVDHRKFELEKEERDRERSRRGAEGSK
jgi:mannitol-specific phosphotransferase system IIBC component